MKAKPAADSNTTQSPSIAAAAAATYGIDAWSRGYFRVSQAGTIEALPERDASQAIDLHEIVQGLDSRGLAAPVLLRFDGILRDRLRRIRESFDAAIANESFGGAYTGLYPIKVNQQRHVCEAIRDEGQRLGFGLEAGSKPELWAVLGLTAATGPGSMPIVCNGFKDDEYIETVVLATKLGRRVIPVIEQPHELDLIIRHAEAYGVRQPIGVRIKPAASGSGRWASSAGTSAKFGLSATELLEAVDLLKQHGLEDTLEMVHFHVGSQISDIRQFKTALSELARIYAELVSLG
ncbi:MAG: arginine decarboxylase, partial [Planctomycetota bacterium]